MTWPPTIISVEGKATQVDHDWFFSATRFDREGIGSRIYHGADAPEYCPSAMTDEEQNQM
jgi:hypothetical protein